MGDQGHKGKSLEIPDRLAVGKVWVVMEIVLGGRVEEELVHLRDHTKQMFATARKRMRGSKIRAVRPKRGLSSRLGSMELLRVPTNKTDWVFWMVVSLIYQQKKAPLSLKTGKKGPEKIVEKSPRVPQLISVPASSSNVAAGSGEGCKPEA